MAIRLPARLEAHLRKDSRWLSCVTLLQEKVQILLSASPEFFPDYTFHSVEHINAVLEHADHLIPPDTILSPVDTGLLICSILIHDLGMFLHRDGVQKLVRSQRSTVEFEEKGWNTVWLEYIDRIKRLPQEQMRYHFGHNIHVSEDCVDSHKLNEDDLRVIGEFLRRHHHRLAHEIAVSTLPGSTDIDLFTGCGISSDERNMIGLLARSHGMAIRDTEAYLESEFEEGSMPLNSPAFYLMAVLRIADSLDVGEHRAPKLLTEQQRLQSPLSVEEWTWNQRIETNKCQWDMEKKNRMIYAHPTTSIEYVQLDKWLRRTQSELDLCWSILAEKYPNDRYRLSIHRITSRIYQKAIHRKMNDAFVTRDVRITANPEIIKLMMEPLYGNDPSYGVRELVQNAVDACIEREDREHRNGNTAYTGRVTVALTKDTFTITDNGIGMNEDVLLNYYLCAGSSYRTSNDWKREFTTDEGSRIARTGRFGIGFLAAFLLGDSISVQTRHMNDQKGYAFQYSGDTRPLNVIRIPNTNIGTTIQIQLRQDIFNTLQAHTVHPWYQWYVFNHPTVEYYVNGVSVTSNHNLLSRNPVHSRDWFSLPSALYPVYLWKPEMSSSIAPNFYCNGFRIEKIPERSLEYYGLDVLPPDVSIIDTNAILDLDPARSVIRKFPDKLLLLQHVFMYHIARLLQINWSSAEDITKNCIDGFPLRSSGHGNSLPFLVSKQGFQINHAAVLSTMSIDRYLSIYQNHPAPFLYVSDIRCLSLSDIPITITYLSESKERSFADFDFTARSSMDAYASLYVSKPSYRTTFSNMGYLPGIYANRIWINSAACPRYRSIFSDPKQWSIVDQPDSVYAVCNSNTLPDQLSADDIILKTANAHPERCSIICEIVIPDDCVDVNSYTFPKYDLSLFAKTLQKVLTPTQNYPDQDMWIPFDMEERKKKFPKAFEELKVYMDYLRDHPVN